MFVINHFRGIRVGISIAEFVYTIINPVNSLDYFLLLKKAIECI